MKTVGAILRRAAAGAALLLALPAGAASLYEETFDPGRNPPGPLMRALLLGSQDAWTGRLVAGGYELENRTAARALRYIFIPGLAGASQAEMAEATVSVSVRGDFAGESGAGLIYRLDPAARRYLALIVRGDGGFLVLRRESEGFSRLAAGRTRADARSRATRLTIDSVQGRLRFRVNDAVVATVEGEAPAGPGLGLIALGVGRFQYDNFSVYLRRGGAGRTN
ncbi:MAG: hypothetical protein AB7O45_04755 [Alphaproteobacteria bacterium]